MDRETVKFQALELRRRECKLCDRVREIYLKIAKKEFGYKSQIPYESAPEFEVWMWERLKGYEWRLNAANIDRIRYEAYGIIYRIKQRLQHAHKRNVDLSEDVYDHVIYDEPTHQPGPEEQAELSELEQIVFRAAAALAPLQHLVFFGVYRANKTPGEIAAETGKPVKTISNALDKAEHRVRVLVERSGTDWEVARGVLNDVDRSRG